MISTSIIFDRKKKAAVDKPGTLEVRITYQRKSYYISTDVRVYGNQWAGAVVSRADADALNNRLRIIIARVNEKANEFIDRRMPIDVKAIKEYVYEGTNVSSKQDRLLTWLHTQIDELHVSEGTRKHYWLLYDRLKEYGGLRSWSDLTVENIYAWDRWLRNNLSGMCNATEKKDVTDGTVHNYHKTLKAMLNRAVTFGIIDVNPYVRLRGQLTYRDNGKIEYLTEGQMQRIVNTHPVVGSQWETVRDLFVFQMFTGMSYSDAQAFDISQYKKISSDGEDKWVYIGQRQKTGVSYVTVLLPPVIDVLQRHGWKVPQISNQTYNNNLKQFGNAIGLPGLHSHLARHTFATFMLSKGAKVQNVMRMMGHRRIEQTMQYANILAKDVQADYDMVAQAITNFNQL